MSKSKGRILVIDDDDYITLSLKLLLEEHFTEVTTVKEPKKIPGILGKQSFDVILLDMNFKQGDTSGEEGIYWLKKIKEMEIDANVILITAYGDVNIAVKTIKEGAIDFVVKPWQNEKLLSTIHAAYTLSQEKKRVKHLRSQQKILSSAMDNQFANIIGQSGAMLDVFKTIEKVAKTNADVLILGDNGTGKEMVARAIHRNSPRAEEVFISVDMGAIQENLFESELFGHKKGAFTDAREDRIGRFEAASGGTIFLDEIGNLSLPLQAKILTVLQSRHITRVGTNDPIPIDVRVICATNSSLATMVKEKRFREDLLYRINTVEITLPPLKERIEDIPLLTEHFLKLYCKKYQKEHIRVPEYVVKKLQKYHWPGNIRELQHALERAVIMCESDNLQAGDFAFLGNESTEEQSFDDFNLEKLEEWAIRNSIKKHHGNISHAAQELGLSRGALYRRMEKYGL
ncbi:sigma-54 dependent transcriptional regulator [Fulvivirgaceae bacterium BMA10]|uniref:Sigma-54 dependent transcriptional regulator n=1 Tax=Splendidivirga corallicola TaxID=3051826 RepID=A0ABT8KK52_9BACT|nr:sigma-54 dependent transcriptional regulator [Fulvivirgaceae bacterium BMA10]